MSVLDRTVTGAAALSLVGALALAAPAVATETIVIRSGQVDGAPGVPPTQDNVGPVDDTVRVVQTAGSAGIPVLDFVPAAEGAPAEIIVPHPAPRWIATLPSDPDARWINHNHGQIFANTGSGRPARSVLYARDFTIEADAIRSATIDFCWAADDRLGDRDGEANPIGVYLNGVALSGDFRGPNMSEEVCASQSVDPAVLNAGGVNTLYVYQRDVGGSVSGVIFSATLTVEEDPCPEETIVIRSGQVDGAPGVPPTQDNVGPVDDTVRVVQTAGSAGIPVLDFVPAAEGAPAEIIVPHPAPRWIATLPSDPDARWINHNHGQIFANTGSGRPARSVLYARDFTIEADAIRSATIDFCWAADDRLGDRDGEANPIGVYLNGVALSGDFRGPNMSEEVCASQSVDPAVLNAGGVNTLYVYQRDVGGSVSGVIFSARLTVTCPRPGDADGDGVVDVADLLAVLGAWGDCPPPPEECPEDFNGDGTVDVIDLLEVIRNWG